MANGNVSRAPWIFSRGDCRSACRGDVMHAQSLELANFAAAIRVVSDFAIERLRIPSVGNGVAARRAERGQQDYK